MHSFSASAAVSRARPSSLRPNPKAQLRQEQQLQEIERHNAQLFDRMMGIMSREDPNQPTHHNLGAASRRRHSSQVQRSILEQSRLAEENRGIWERLEQQKPTISNQKLREERLKSLNILRFLGKYPNREASRYTDSAETGDRQLTRHSQEGPPAHNLPKPKGQIVPNRSRAMPLSGHMISKTQ